MAEALIFHYREQHTYLNHCNPVSKLLCVIALCFPLVKAPLFGTLLLLSPLLLLSLIQRLPLKRYAKELRFFIFMTCLIALTEYLATKSALLALTACLRFLTIILSGMLISDSTAPDDLARSLGNLLDRIPFVNGWNVASSIELSLSLIPMIFDVTDQVITARKARLERNRNPIKNLTSLGSSIFSLLLDRAEELSWALDARAFEANRKRQTLPYTYRDLLLIAITTMFVFLTYMLY